MLQVRMTNYAGRGVFTTEPVRRGTKLISDHVIVMNRADRRRANRTLIGQYAYEWKSGCAVSLGMGSLVNHSSDPNAFVRCNLSTTRVEIFAKRDLRKGEEVVIDYGYKLKLR